MGDGSKIQWTDASWNPATGCSHVSEGCDNCYAETLTRMKAAAGVWEAPDLPWTAENAEANVILHPERLDQPLRWRKPRMIFVNSMSDLFHPRIPTEFIDRVFGVMAAAPQHTFQILTKRPKRMRDYLRSDNRREAVLSGAASVCNEIALRGGSARWKVSVEVWPLPNVWLGTSIESRDYVGRADLVRETPAAIRFISAEPLLGPLVPTQSRNLDSGAVWNLGEGREELAASDDGLDLTDIDWLIVGGESGDGHRPIEQKWVTDLLEACIGSIPIPLQGGPEDNDLIPDDDGSGTAFFFKQWGGRTAKAGGRELLGRTWDDFPDPVAPEASQAALL